MVGSDSLGYDDGPPLYRKSWIKRSTAILLEMEKIRALYNRAVHESHLIAIVGGS